MLLIAYASKSGTAREAAESLATLLPSATLVDLAQETPRSEDFDAIIIGSGVRMGSINKLAKEFMDKNENVLLTKRFAFFITHSFTDTSDEIIDRAVSAQLRSHAVWIGPVGGLLQMERIKGLDRFIAKAATKSVEEGQKINEGLDVTALKELAACFE